MRSAARWPHPAGETEAQREAGWAGAELGGEPWRPSSHVPGTVTESSFYPCSQDWLQQPPLDTAGDPQSLHSMSLLLDKLAKENQDIRLMQAELQVGAWGEHTGGTGCIISCLCCSSRPRAEPAPSGARALSCLGVSRSRSVWCPGACSVYRPADTSPLAVSVTGSPALCAGMARG